LPQRKEVMAKFDQIVMLQQMESQVERHLRDAIGRFQNLRDGELNTPSATGGWSIAQCLWHLNSYGHYYHPHVAKALAAASALSSDGTFKETWLGAKFAKMMDPTTGTMRMKAFKANTPSKKLNGPEVVAEFIAQQETLLLHLRSAMTVDLRSVSIPVTILPWLRLPLGDVLRFLVAHDRRHVEQALRNLAVLEN
jgi:hypothetical protein